MIRAAVVGSAGYAGGEVLRLLMNHPLVGLENVVAVSDSFAGQPVWKAHPDLEGGTNQVFASTVPDGVDVIFLCLGHGMSAQWLENNPVSETTVVIDLGSDFRVQNGEHSFVYGLPEKNREQIRTSRRIANPGCFATAIQLGLLPLAETDQLTGNIVVNAITGSTGAGQLPTPTTHYSRRNNNVSTYKVFEHQHEAEIRQTLGDVQMHLVPVRGPFTRGIHATIVLPGKWSNAEVQGTFRDRYANHPFVVVCEELPSMKQVVNTNMCHIGVLVNNNAMIVVAVIDNLIKGAAGQAVQNMNLVFGFDEKAGLNLISSVY